MVPLEELRMEIVADLERLLYAVRSAGPPEPKDEFEWRLLLLDLRWHTEKLARIKGRGVRYAEGE